MRDTFIASCDRELTPSAEGAAPEWVHLLPTGEIAGFDGRSYVLREPQKLIDDFLAGGLDLPVDYHHQNDGKSPGALAAGPIPAAGWIKELTLAANGIWGKVSWTDRAKRLIAEKEYRYLSPTFYHLKDRSIIRLKGAGLVHNPNLKLVALAQEEPAPVEGVLPRLATMLGLAADATEEAVADAVAKLAKVAADDGGAAVNAEDPDPSRFVPIEAVEGLLADRNRWLATMAEDRAAAKVDDAFRRGYLTMSMRPWDLALCQRDEASFDGFLASTLPAFAHLTRQSAPSGAPPRSAADAETDAEAAVCAQLGLPAGALNS